MSGEARVATVDDAGHEIDDHCRVRFEHDAHADRDNRIEHRAFRVAQCGDFHRLRMRQVATAANKARAIGFIGDRLDIGSVHRDQMEHPWSRVVLSLRTAMAQDRLLRAQQFGLHEQLAEGRMHGVGCRGRKHHFGVAGQLDRAARTAAVGDRDAAQLDVVLGRHHDFGVGVDVVLAATEFGARIGEDRSVAIDRYARGLMPSGPERTALRVAQITKAAGRVGGRILAPPGHGHLAQLAVAAAPTGHHHVIAAIGQHLHGGYDVVRVAEDPQPGFGRIRNQPLADRLDDMRLDDRGSRHALLQQQHGRLEVPVRAETQLHRPLEQRMRERQQAHALVMRHERADDRGSVAARQARLGKIDRFVHAECAAIAGRGQPLQVGACLLRRDHQRQRRGIRRDHQILRKPALQTQARYAESAVLVVELRIECVVTRLRDTPRGHRAGDRNRSALRPPRASLRRAGYRRNPASTSCGITGTRTSSRSTTTATDLRPRL